MKKNRVTVIIVVILLIIAVFLVLTNTSSTLRRDVSDFTLKDTSNVVKIFLADRMGNDVTLEKTGIGEWTIDGKHIASFDKVKALLKTMSDLRVMKPVAKSAHNTVVKRLATNARKVEIYQEVPRINMFGWIKLFPHVKLTKTYYVGGPTQDNMGTYMLMENSSKPYIIYIPMLRGFISPRFSPLGHEWRDHQVFKHKLRNIKSIRLEFFMEPENSYSIINLDNLNFDLIDDYHNQKLTDYDTLKMLSFVSSFEDVRFEAMLSGQLEQKIIDSVTQSAPAHRITLIDQGGDSTIVTTFYKKGFQHLYKEDGLALEPFDLDRLYGLVNDDKDFVLIQYFVFDKVLRPLSWFRKES